VQHAFSQRSIARLYERTDTRNDGDVIAAMTSALAFDPSDPRLSDEVHIGNWRGIKQNPTNDDTVQLWCARIWIDAL
jgi:hypothetical protein